MCSLEAETELILGAVIRNTRPTPPLAKGDKEPARSKCSVMRSLAVIDPLAHQLQVKDRSRMN